MKIKNLLLTEILPICENFSLNCIKRICYSISIILGIGSLTLNTTTIEEIILYGKTSVSKCYISIIILNSMYFEIKKLKILKEAITVDILDFLKGKISLVIDYINFLLENFDLMDSQNSSLSSFKDTYNLNVKNKITVKELKDEILDLIESWHKLNINIFFIPNIYYTLLNSFNPENCEKISFIFANCISILPTVNYYTNMDIFDVSKLLREISEEHLQILEGLLKFIDNWIKNKINIDNIHNNKNFNMSIYNKNNPSGNSNQTTGINLTNDPKISSKDVALLESLAYLFSFIIEKYAFLLFIETSVANIIYQNFILFLSSKNLRISAMMFKALEEICFFIKESEFQDENISSFLKSGKSQSQLNNEIKTFLIDITSLIMFNCKFTNITIPILKTQEKIMHFYQIELEEENDFDVTSAKYLTVTEYRKQAGEAFYDIFSIFVENLQKKGVLYFVEYLLTIIENNNLVGDSNKEDEGNNNYVASMDKNYIIEVIINMLNSIFVCFYSQDFYIDYLIEITLKIFTSGILVNEFILCSFLAYLYNIAECIPKNNELLSKSLELLFYTLKNKKFEIVSTSMLSYICENMTVPSQEIFTLIYNFYLEKFDNLELSSAKNVTLALIDSVRKLNLGSNHYTTNYRNDNTNVLIQKSQDEDSEIKKCFNIKDNTKIFVQNFLNYSNKDILGFLELILNPVHTALEKIQSFISESSNLISLNNNLELRKILQNSILKGLIIYQSVFEKFQACNFIFKNILNVFYAKFFDIIEFVIKTFISDKNFINCILNSFDEMIHENITAPYFDAGIFFSLFERMNTLCLFVYSAIPSCEKVFDILIRLYQFPVVFSTEEQVEFKKKMIIAAEAIENNTNQFCDLGLKRKFLSYYINVWAYIINPLSMNFTFEINKFNEITNFFIDEIHETKEFDCNTTKMILYFFVILFKKVNQKYFPREFFINKILKIVARIFEAYTYINQDTFHQVFHLSLYKKIYSII